MDKGQLEILSKLCLKEISIHSFLAELDKKTTNVSREVSSRIRNVIDNDNILVSEDICTVINPFSVTKKEISQIEQFTKLPYRTLSEILTDKELWINWINIENKK